MALPIIPGWLIAAIIAAALVPAIFLFIDKLFWPLVAIGLALIIIFKLPEILRWRNSVMKEIKKKKDDNKKS